MKKKLIPLLLAAAMLVTTAAATQTQQQTLTATYGVQLVVDGQARTLTDVNGTVVRPFVSNGTTYVPIRAIAELFGAEVSYDRNSNTATIQANLNTSDAGFEYVDMMAFYKCLEEGLVEISDIFYYIALSDISFFTEKTENGEIVGESLCNVLKEYRSAVESHYDYCFTEDLLSENDIALMTEYRRLSDRAIDVLNTIQEGGNSSTISSIVGAASQDFYYSELAELQANSGFWDTYNSSF